MIAFINVVLKRTRKELIQDKTGVIDGRAKTSKGEHIDIEVQLTDKGNMDNFKILYTKGLQH